MNKKFNISITSTKKRIDTIDKTEKSQKTPEPVVTYKNRKIDTVGKSDKSKSILVNNISNKSTQIEKKQK